MTQADRELAETQTAYEDTLADYQSTSAQLRETQRALAASQADLSRCERERDEALASSKRRLGVWRVCSEHRDLILAELTTAIQERDLLRAQLDQAVVYFDRRHTELREAFQQLKAVYHKGRDHIVDVEQELFDARAKLAAANAEIERLRAAADKESAQ